MLGAQVGVGEYEQRVQQQIKQYATTENMHQLPKSFAYWQRKYFLPAFETIFGVKNHLEFYAKYLGEGMTSSKCWRIASLGCGDGAVEVAIARLLRRNGIDEFVFSLVDLSGPQLDRARRNVEQSGLAENFAFVEADFNVWNATQSYGGVMVHHALHHVQNLEHLTVEIYRCLADEGLFCTIDVIGRNGHQRWPEALDIIEKMWAFLPPEKKLHRIFKVVDHHFRNHDCSTQGFEGIRAQDILPLLVSTFGFSGFFCFGNLIDVFTTRAYGANFEPENATDAAFIDFVQYLNELLIDLGHLKPTRMSAVMTKNKKCEPRVYKNWTPEFAIRRVG